MYICKISNSEIQVNVDGKGYFDVIFDDWGGEYPGVDIEWVPNSNNVHNYAWSSPRVIFEIEKDSDNPVVRIWEDPNSEDSTYSHEFDMSNY